MLATRVRPGLEPGLRHEQLQLHRNLKDTARNDPSSNKRPLALTVGLAVGVVAIAFGLGVFDHDDSGERGAATTPAPSTNLDSEPTAAAGARNAEAIDAIKQRRKERAERTRIAREARVAQELAVAAIPVSERLAETRGREGKPAAGRPDLEMIRAKGGAPLTEQEAAVASSLVLEEGKKAMAAGDLTLAFEHLFRATELHGSLEAHATLGDLLVRSRQAWRADEHLRKAAEIDPQNPDRWIALANAYAIKPDPIAASRAIKRAKELEPEIVVERDDGGLYKRGG